MRRVSSGVGFPYTTYLQTSNFSELLSAFMILKSDGKSKPRMLTAWGVAEASVELEVKDATCELGWRL